MDEPQTQDTDSSEDCDAVIVLEGPEGDLTENDEIPQQQDGNLEEQNVHLEIYRRPQRLSRPPDWTVEYKMTL